MLKQIFIVFLAMFILGWSRISSAQMCGHTSHHQTEEVVSEESINVGNKICPISGEKIDEEMKATYKYEGRIYNFCCASCIDEFKKNPQEYLEKIKKDQMAE